MTTEFFIFGLARLTWICNPSTDSETSLKVTRCWKFSQKTKLEQNVLLIVKKKWEIFFKTGTIVSRMDVTELSLKISHFMVILEQLYTKDA